MQTVQTVDQNFSVSPMVGLAFALVYASDRQKSVAFYEKYFSFKVDNKHPMDGDQIYGTMGSVGIWIGGSHKQAAPAEKDTRATVMFQVKSASELFSKLKHDGVKLYQEKPVKMAAQSFWFQCADPDGNILEFLGNE